jgi:cell division protein FtsQ
VQRVAISGRFQRVQALDVEKAVRGQIGRQGLLAIDLARVSLAVERIDWVDRASVARAWPRGLHVHLVEQVPVARWGDSGLVNERGELFVNDARRLPVELPELTGPEGMQAPMTARYLHSQSRLAEAGMRLAKVRLDQRGAWELGLDNGVVLRLGRLGVDERFDRFMVTASRIVATRATEIAYVDMRYANGFAIGWRSRAEGAKRG